MTPSSSHDKLPPFTQAVLFMLVAYISIAIMGVFVKLASIHVPASQILFSRFFIGLLFLLPMMFSQPTCHFKIRDVKYSALRNVAGLLSMLLMFYSLQQLPVSIALLLANTSALFVPVFMLLLFRHKTSWLTMLCTISGFLGICIIFYAPQVVLDEVYVLIGVLGAAFAALAYIGIKQLSASHSPLAIIFQFYASSSIAIPLFTFYDWVWPSWHELLYLVMVGMFGLIFQICVTKAFALSDVGDITPFMFVGVIFSVLCDWLIWNTVPNTQFWLGSIVIVLSASVLAKLTTMRQ